MTESEQVSEFYFIASIDNPVLVADVFDVVRGAMDLSCVMIHDTQALDDAPDEARAIISHIQSRDIAVLIKNAPDKAGSLDADCVHLDMEQNFNARIGETQARITGDPLIGVEVDNSRHAAMTCAEKGADYIAFNCAPNNMIEMISWWSELFEIPSVAWRITDVAMAKRCSEAGVDFIALDLDSIALSDAPMDALAPFQAAIDKVTKAA